MQDTGDHRKDLIQCDLLESHATDGASGVITLVQLCGWCIGRDPEEWEKGGCGY